MISFKEVIIIKEHDTDHKPVTFAMKTYVLTFTVPGSHEITYLFLQGKFYFIHAVSW